MNEMIYLDNHSTTPLDPRVLETMNDVYKNYFGNPSSVDHSFGEDAKAIVTQAARQVGALLDVNFQNVIFTSGATESINLAIKGKVQRLKDSKSKIKIILSPVEHHAVVSCCESIGGAELVYLKVDKEGRIDLPALKMVCEEGADLLCVMAVNHEIGNIYPIEQISKIANDAGVEFFCDATQGVGKIPISFDAFGISYLALSAHKFYGPKGVGALLVKNKNKLEPILHGGGQQYGLRSGTLNVPGIAGLGRACELRGVEQEVDERQIGGLKALLIEYLVSELKDLVFIGDQENKVAGNLAFSALGANNHGVISRIRTRVAISTGSACSSGVIATSKVLRAIRRSQNEIEGFLRVCIGKFTTEAEIVSATQLIIAAIKECRDANFVGGKE